LKAAADGLCIGGYVSTLKKNIVYSFEQPSKGKVLEIVSFFDTKDTDKFNILHDDIWWL
jgi:hypothetical protein